MSKNYNKNTACCIFHRFLHIQIDKVGVCYVSTTFRQQFPKCSHVSYNISESGDLSDCRYGSDAHNEIFSWPCGDPDTQWTALSADTKTANGCAVPPRGWAHTLSEHKGVLYLFGGQNYDGRTNSLYRLEMKQGGFNTPTCLWNLVRKRSEVSKF